VTVDNAIEETVKECLEKRTPGQRRSIWPGTEAGLRSGLDPTDMIQGTIDMDLEVELLDFTLQSLLPAGGHEDSEDSEDGW